MHYWTDFQSVHGFRYCDDIALNAKCQRVLVLALCLVDIGATGHATNDFLLLFNCNYPALSCTVDKILSLYDMYQLLMTNQRCIMANVLQTKVDAQCDKLATERS